MTIRGTGFAAGVTITFGGRAATDVSVRGTDVMTAKTAVSPVAATVDVVIVLNGRTDALVGGFRYEPIGPNTAPVIKSIAAQGKRLRQPPTFADYGETIQITVVVEDAESAATQLAYEWLACDGTFNGTGPQVEWTAPALGSLPSTCTIEVTVLDGPHALTRSIPIRLHNSTEEMRSLVMEFLNEFADSSITDAAAIVRDFSDSCSGKAAEQQEITANRQTRIINSHTYGSAAVTTNFGGVCAFRSRTADACVATPVEWQSTIIATGGPETAKGTSHIAGIYENSRWWLCRSEYRPDLGTSLTFMH